MNVSEFYSESKYVFLPNRNKPKLVLAVNDKKVAERSLTMFNPFSSKVRLFKIMLNIVLVDLNFLSTPFLGKRHKKSDFTVYLESVFKKTLNITIYSSTDGDKFVLQIQDETGICGFVKVSSNAIGRERISKERDALDHLNKLNIENKYIDYGKFKDSLYIITNPISGDVKLSNNYDSLMAVLNKYKSSQSEFLTNHPRVLELVEFYTNSNKLNLANKIKLLSASSTSRYFVVFEHGDFAPWNILSDGELLTPFDFDYSCIEGLEFMDIFKYYFQIGRLIKGLGVSELKSYVLENIQLEEKEILYNLFIFVELKKILDVGDEDLFITSIVEELSN